MSAGLLLAAVCLPMCAGLLAGDYGPRAYYVAQALLVALLLWRLPAPTLGHIIARWAGVVIQIAAAGYGLTASSGAVEWHVVIGLLFGVGLAAEVVIQLQESACRSTTK